MNLGVSAPGPSPVLRSPYRPPIAHGPEDDHWRMKQGIRWHVLEQAGWNFHHVRYVPKNVGMLMTRGTLHVEYRINTKDLFSMEEIHERVLWVAEQVHLATVGCSQIPNLD